MWAMDEQSPAVGATRLDGWSHSPSLSIAASTQQNTPSSSYPPSTTSSCLVARRLGHAAGTSGMRSPPSDNGSPFGSGGGAFPPSRLRMSPALERIMMDETERLAGHTPKPFVPQVNWDQLGSGGGGSSGYRTLSPAAGHSPSASSSPPSTRSSEHSLGLRQAPLPDFFPGPSSRDYDQIDALMESVPAAVAITPAVSRLRGGGSASPSTSLASGTGVPSRSRFATLGASFAESPSHAARRDGFGFGLSSAGSGAGYADMDEEDESASSAVPPAARFGSMPQRQPSPPAPLTSPDAPVMQTRRLGGGSGLRSKCASPALSYGGMPSARSFTPPTAAPARSLLHSSGPPSARMLLDSPATAMRSLAIQR